jgi:hypothetical protein
LVFRWENPRGKKAQESKRLRPELNLQGAVKGHSLILRTSLEFQYKAGNGFVEKSINGEFLGNERT